jgi:hypothetical protein
MAVNAVSGKARVDHPVPVSGRPPPPALVDDKRERAGPALGQALAPAYGNLPLSGNRAPPPEDDKHHQPRGRRVRVRVRVRALPRRANQRHFRAWVVGRRSALKRIAGVPACPRPEAAGRCLAAAHGPVAAPALVVAAVAAAAVDAGSAR